MKYIKHICIAHTTYTLSFYLLYMSIGDIEKTLFFVGDTINSEIKKRLPNVVCIPTKNFDWKTGAKYKFLKYLHWPCLAWCPIYAQDHITYSDVLIGNRKYTFIEDSPGTFSQLDEVSFLGPFIPNRGDCFKRRIKYFLAHSAIHGKTFGTNNQCTNRIITSPKDIKSKYVEGRSYELASLADLWKNCDDEKKEFIINLFSISRTTINDAPCVDLLILSQPFVEDCGLSLDEMLQLYKPYVERFNSIVIKIHPRDKFDYKKYFPNVEIMRNQAPMQLLNAMGVVYPRALTVCSTALSAMPSNTERIYLGTKINSKILDTYGDLCN